MGHFIDSWAYISKGFASGNAVPEGMWVQGGGIDLPC